MSSVFAASVLREVPAEPEVVLDVCASPGGKSLFAWRCLRPRLLVANEVIVKRTAPLISNLKRCHVKPALVTNADTAVLARVCPASADVVIVDGAVQRTVAHRESRGKRRLLSPRNHQPQRQPPAPHPRQRRRRRRAGRLAGLHHLHVCGKGERGESALAAAAVSGVQRRARASAGRAIVPR